MIKIHDLTTTTQGEKMKFYHLVSAISILATSTYANQPSFNCDKVKKSSPEGFICTSDQLMDLDKKMAVIYKKALAKAPKSDKLKEGQRGWIKSRNECQKKPDEKTCMVDKYNLRINELTKKYALPIKKEAQDEDAPSDFNRVLKLDNISFHIEATNEGSLNELTIIPSGLKGANDIIKQEIDGSVTNAEVGDLNQDGFAEVYVYVTSAGSGGYGSLVAYSANHNKSLSQINLPSLEDDEKNSAGYMGHDQFSLKGDLLIRRFPIYLKDDPNCCPKGNTRELQYKLVQGEATWQLKLVKSSEVK